MPAEGNGPGAASSWHERLRRALRGRDRAESPALPVGEAMHPITLAAITLLLVNDWVLKPSYGPSAITGKLSDIGGLIFAPVVLSSAIGVALALAAKLGARVDPSLSRRRLVLCTAATGIGFTAVKLSATAAGWLVSATEIFGRHAEVYLDRTDLLCLPCLAIALWIGRDELRRVPLGRAAAIHRLRRPARAALADVGNSPALDALADAIDAWDPARIDALLDDVSRV